MRFLPCLLVFAWLSPLPSPPAPPPAVPGDVVLRLDGEDARQALAAEEALVSAATPQWRRFRALGQLALGGEGTAARLLVQTRSGERREVTVSHTVSGSQAQGPFPKPPVVREVKPGVVVVDLDRAGDEDLTAALPQLEKADGLVFDLRGYPRSSPLLLSHLIDKPITCPQWHVPTLTRPDRADMRFTVSDWPVEPAAPRLRARVAFATDGRAISYAETYLGMVENYKLGAIVGGPTAGTNGNVNAVELPGGYRLRWTGMKVLKHDGSRHHGVGILPTVPVSRTIAGVAAGRDEVLEKAIEVVSRPR